MSTASIGRWASTTLCALSLLASTASRAQEATSEIPPPPIAVGPTVRIPADYGGFKTVGPCFFEAIGPDRRKALLDAYRAGGRAGYEKQMNTYTALIPAMAERCNPLVALQIRPTVLAWNSYLERTTALALLNEFGVTQTRLDEVEGPETASLFAYIHSVAVSIVTDDANDRIAPTADASTAIVGLTTRFGFTTPRREIGRQALFSYYVGRDTVSVPGERTHP